MKGKGKHGGDREGMAVKIKILQNLYKLGQWIKSLF